MARPLRVDVVDGWYHCMNRGIERRSIFTDRRDRAHFVDLIGETVERYRFRVHAYCLMDNHYHLLLQTPDANLSRGMHWLGLSYGTWFNARHQRVGHLFQGRFKSVPVEAARWAFELNWYIHLNPVHIAAFGLDKQRRAADRVGILPPPSAAELSERLKRLREYRWSSYRAYAGYGVAPEWLVTADLLGRVKSRAEDPRRAYRERIQGLLKHGVEESRLEAFREAVALGSSAFVDRIKRLASGGDRETERRVRLRDRVSVESVIQAVEACRSEPRDTWLHRHGDWGKWMVLRVARANTGLTLAQLGEAIGGKDYAAVGMGLKSFGRKLRANKSLQRTHQQVLQLLHLEM